ASNIPSYNVYLTVDNYYNDEGEIDTEKLGKVSAKIEEILGEKWSEYVLKPDETYSSVYERMLDYIDKYYFLSELLVASGIDNEKAIKLKAYTSIDNSITVDDATKRYYSNALSTSHILGYVAKVNADDLETRDYVDMNDFVGKSGVEYYYDRQLIGQKGEYAVEIDAYGNIVSDLQMNINEVVPGKNLYLTIDNEIQNNLYNSLQNGVNTYGGNGGAGIVMDVNTGEILAMASYPSYDNNLFVDGISSSEYEALTSDTRLPLFDRTISAQIPPGSIFKTIVGSSALDAGAIDRYTKYNSTSDYSFSNGASFWEYGRRAYGWIDIIGALEVSSNIFFCETVRNWDMDSLVPYLEKFGIGEYTNIDIPGEMPGRLPSAQNKIALANSSSPWLEPVWYPEGDSCNSVIGQGITLVTPIQAVNWVSAIANGGQLNTPHVANYFEEISPVDGEKITEKLDFEPINQNIVSDSALQIVREGMRETVVGSSGFLYFFNELPFSVAAKTGTAEFGAVNADGKYEHTHAWVIGFYPYESPRYAFAFYMEDSTLGTDAAMVARDFLRTIPEKYR
ncbi:MAG TPA: penicillin-binding transpeptidase domain-containing protein, partial [Candidatus Dojkabacteria bacterium]|nr:penicillin-binding transpeptidase domain-containing protein [Candidatus Dojkabacteria bacterium]